MYFIRQTIVIYKAVNENFLFAWSYDDFLEFAQKIKKLPALSKQRQRLSRTILAAAKPVQIDSDGRIVLPQDLVGFAGLEEKASFIGMGAKFQIWNPSSFEKRRDVARQAVQSKGLTIPKGSNGGKGE